MSEMIKFVVDRSPMEALVAMPMGTGPYPAVVLLYHQNGYSPFTRDCAQRLAEAGYAVIAPDNFHHSSPDLDAKGRKAFLRDSQVINDIAACVDWLHNNERIDASNIAVLGHCQGGRMAFLGASALPQVFKAAVIYYSGNMFTTRGGETPTPFERLKDIRCPVIGFFGAEDHSPSPEEVDKIEAELLRHHVAHQFHRYQGAGHGFCDFKNAKHYHASATLDSWEKTLGFLKERLCTPAKIAAHS